MMADGQDCPLLNTDGEDQVDHKLNGKVVLVAMDGSEHSFYAFHWYMQHVHQKGSNLVILHCPEIKTIMKVPLRSTDANYVRDMLRDHDQEVKTLVERIKDSLRLEKVNARLIKQAGDPGHVIVKVANDYQASLIVTGTRGQSHVRRTLIGSVSDYILHHAHCPVLICRKDQQA